MLSKKHLKELKTAILTDYRISKKYERAYLKPDKYKIIIKIGNLDYWSGQIDALKTVWNMISVILEDK